VLLATAIFENFSAEIIQSYLSRPKPTRGSVPIEDKEECIKWSLVLPILSRYYIIGFGRKTVYSLLQKVT